MAYSAARGDGLPSIVVGECVRLVTRLAGSRRQRILNGLAMALVSFGLPWYMGLAFLRSLVVIPLACLSVFLVADLVGDSFAASPGLLDICGFVGRAGACVLVGWTCGLAMLSAGLVAVNALHWEDRWLLPPIMILADAALLSLAASVFVSGVAVCVGLKSSSARSARLALKLVMLLTAILLMYGCSRSLISGRLFLTNQRITRLTWTASVFFVANGAALVAYAASVRSNLAYPTK